MKSTLKIHVLKNHNDIDNEETKSRECTFCNKRFAIKGLLQSHVKSYHNVKYPNACKFCDKTLSSTNELKRHIASIHDSIKPFMKNIKSANRQKTNKQTKKKESQ